MSSNFDDVVQTAQRCLQDQSLPDSMKISATKLVALASIAGSLDRIADSLERMGPPHNPDGFDLNDE